MDRTQILAVVTGALVVVAGLVRRIPWAGAALAAWIASPGIAEWVTDRVIEILAQIGNSLDVAAVRTAAEGFAAKSPVMGSAPPAPEQPT